MGTLRIDLSTSKKRIEYKRKGREIFRKNKTSMVFHK